MARESSRSVAQRHIEERVGDIVRAAKSLNFQLVVGHPAVDTDDILRNEPPGVPGQPRQLVFYIGKKAWKRYEAAYLDIMSPERRDAVLAGIEITFYEPTPESTSGETE
jgi:hypothetical protein